jgi:hypothetical protein
MSSQSYFSLAGEQERLGNLGAALNILRAASVTPEMKGISSNFISSMTRVLIKAAHQAKAMAVNASVIHENSANPNNYSGTSLYNKLAPVVSLTTISSRISQVVKTIETITTQTFPPHSINLYISEEPYLIDDGISDKNDNLKKIIDLGANVYMVKNIGPYRKQYPIIWQLRKGNASPEAMLVTIDDDVIYPPGILKQLTDAACINDAIVAHRGREIAFNNGNIVDYMKFIVPKNKISCLNLATGINGILYKLKYFPNDLSEYMGPFLAPTADDIWCKWVAAIRGIPTSIIEPFAAFRRSLDFTENILDRRNCLFHAFNNKGANNEAIANMEAFFLLRSGINIASIYGR